MFLGNAFVTSFNDRINSPAPRTIANEEFNTSVDSIFSPIITASARGSILPLRAEGTTLLQVNTTVVNDPGPETRTTALNGLEHLLNDDSASADHDVITLLAGNRDEANELDTNIQSNDAFITSTTPASNQRRAQISNRDSIIIDELRTNVTLRSIYDIIIKYYSSTITAYTISKRLFNLQPDEVLTLSAILKLTAAKYRPGREEQSQMVQDLISLNLFSITSPRSNAYLIRKL